MQAVSKVDVDFNGPNVSRANADRQKATMERILDKLRDQPGVVLCDEVGMGKTYVALGVIANYLSRYGGSRVLILTPSEDLAQKWRQDLARFRSVNVSKAVESRMSTRSGERPRLTDLLGAKDKSGIWILPLSVFFKSRDLESWRELRIIVTDLVARAANLSREQRKVLWRRLGGSHRKVPRRGRRLYWNDYEVPSFRTRVRRILGLGDGSIFDPQSVSDTKLRAIRDEIEWMLVRERFRRFSMIVVDEAHNLRNPDTKRYRAIEAVFKKTFRDMLFLTATPFQLGPEELKNILLLFRLSCEPKAGSMEAEAAGVSKCAESYREGVEALENAWKMLSDDERKAIDAPKPGSATAALGAFCEACRDLQCLHSALQQTLSKWVIRSVQDRQYRVSHDEPIPLAPGSQLTFAMMQRLLHEYRRSQRTFSATQNVSLTSSWEAFRASQVMKSDSVRAQGVKFYRKVMGALVPGRNESHPKFGQLLDIVRHAIKCHEKVLVFTSRIETVKSLHKLLNEKLESDLGEQVGVGREEMQKRLRQIRKRSTAARDSLYLLFTENYYRSCLKRIPSVESIYPDVLRQMCGLRRDCTIGRVGAAKSPQWELLSKLCECAVFGEEGRFEPRDDESAFAMYSACHYAMKQIPRKLTPEDERQVLARHSCSAAELKRWIRRILSRRSIWDGHAKELSAFKDLEVREELLNALVHVLLVPEWIGRAIASYPKSGRGRIEGLLLQDLGEEPVKERVSRFLKDMAGLQDVNGEIKQYTKGLSPRSLVARASGEESMAERTNHRYGFNTPFRPYVLVASEIMQEGLDLHRECARIVHYDLAWNPARLEQRVGRIDRIGSRVDVQLRNGKKAELHIHRHHIPGTIDEKMFHRVRERERWFKFILGHKPEWEESGEEHPGATVLLPQRYSRDFVIQLGTHRRRKRRGSLCEECSLRSRG